MATPKVSGIAAFVSWQLVAKGSKVDCMQVDLGETTNRTTPLVQTLLAPLASGLTPPGGGRSLERPVQAVKAVRSLAQQVQMVTLVLTPGTSGRHKLSICRCLHCTASSRPVCRLLDS